MAEKIYSIWLMPEGETRTRLSKVINQLATEYNAPSFEPHVTLVGAVSENEEEMIKKTNSLASRISPYEITLGAVEYTNIYFRALYARVVLTAEVQQSYERAREIFPDIESEYMPHLSYLYGFISPEQKKQAVSKIEGRPSENFIADKLHLIETSLEHIKSWQKIGESVFESY